MTNNPLPSATAEIVAKWREEFKRLVTETPEYANSLDFIRPHIFDIGENGRYKSSDTETLWQGFLMARQSVVIIEPPKLRIDGEYDAYAHGDNEAIDEYTQSIESQGYAASRE